MSDLTTPHPPIDSIHQGMPLGCRPDEPIHPGLSHVVIESHVAFDNDTHPTEGLRYVTIANKNGANSRDSQTLPAASLAARSASADGGAS